MYCVTRLFARLRYLPCPRTYVACNVSRLLRPCNNVYTRQSYGVQLQRYFSHGRKKGRLSLLGFIGVSAGMVGEYVTQLIN